MAYTATLIDLIDILDDAVKASKTVNDVPSNLSIIRLLALHNNAVKYNDKVLSKKLARVLMATNELIDHKSDVFTHDNERGASGIANSIHKVLLSTQQDRAYFSFTFLQDKVRYLTVNIVYDYREKVGIYIRAIENELNSNKGYITSSMFPTEHVMTILQLLRQYE